MRYKTWVTSIQGCQPKLPELAKAWGLALQGLDGQELSVLLTHVTKPKIETPTDLLPRLESERIEADNLENLSDEVGDWYAMDNLTLLASQKMPYRRVQIAIGPGRYSIVEFEALAGDHWVVDSHEAVVRELSQAQRFFRTVRKASRFINQLSDVARTIIQLAIALACLIAVIYVLYFLIYPVSHLISVYVHGKHPHKHDIIPLVWTVAVLVLARQAYLAIKSLTRSYVRRSRAPFWSSKSAGMVVNTVGACATIAALIVTVVK